MSGVAVPLKKKKQGHCGESACFFVPSRRRRTRWYGDWSSDVCSSDLPSVAVTTQTSWSPSTRYLVSSSRQPVEVLGLRKPTLSERISPSTLAIKSLAEP